MDAMEFQPHLRHRSTTPSPVRPAQQTRPRAYSFHPSSSASSDEPKFSSMISFPYGSSLLESLDLGGSVSNLRQYLLGKLEEAEEGVRALKAFMEESTLGENAAEEDAFGGDTEEDAVDDDENEEDDDSEEPVGTTTVDETETEEEMDLLTARRQRRRRHTTRRTPPSEDLSSLAQFVQMASGYLSALRAELPAPSLSSPLQFQLSPEGRLALDHFLDDYPLPSFPTSLSASSSHLLARVTSSLASLQDLVARPPSPPSTRSVTEYFKSEAASLGRGIRDEVDELSHLLVERSSAALDEAARIYNAALEGGRKRLLRYEELPHEWRNNEHILSGYRFIPVGEWGTLLRSAFEYHNETVNIQTHFLGFFFLLYLLYLLPSSPHYLPESHWADTAVAVLFLAAGMKCLLCSTAWHLFAGCATLHLHEGAACVDYVGISALIAASVMGIEYYGFYCRSDLASAYMMFTASLGVAGMILPWKPWFNQRRFKMYRIAFFLGLASSALMPIVHMAAINSYKQTIIFFLPILPSVLAYLTGLSFYANQFPECAAPGRWDNLLASHQLWHIAIVIAVWQHWRAMGIWATAASEGRALSCL